MFHADGQNGHETKIKISPCSCTYIETQTNPPAYLWDTKKVLAMKTVSFVDCCTSSKSTSAMVHWRRRGSSSFRSPSNMPYTAPTPSAKLSTARADTHNLSQKQKKDRESQWQSILLQGASLKKEGNSLAVLWLGLTSNTRNTGLIPDQKTKILYAMWCSPDWEWRRIVVNPHLYMKKGLHRR